MDGPTPNPEANAMTMREYPEKKGEQPVVHHVGFLGPKAIENLRERARKAGKLPPKPPDGEREKPS